jgi:Carboxypeptidase regulatory-like domain
MFKTSLRVVCLLSLCAIGMFAQAGNGGITGTVRDASGAPVPNATVTVANTSKGIKRDLQTTSAGLFNAPSLVPASGYTVEASAPGFAKYQAENVTVQVGSNVDLDVTLQIASSKTTVEVTTTAETVDDTKSGVTDLINQLQIDNLPINGRRADTFALLTPRATARSAL